MGRERQRGRMHSSRVSLFIVATCLRLFQEEDVSSQGRVPLFFCSTAGRLLLPRGSSVLLLACAQQFLLFIFARSHRRSSAADSGPVSTSFCMFFVCFLFFYKYKSSTFFAVWLRPLNAPRFIRSFVHFSLTPSKKKKDGFASALHVANAVPFCLTGAQSVPEHVWCQWQNAGPFISGITLDG